MAKKTKSTDEKNSIARMHDYQRERIVRQKYEEFRNIVSGLNKSVEAANAFIRLNNLSETKTNDTVSTMLTELCQRELESVMADLEGVFDKLQVVEGEAKVLEFKKAA